MQVLFWVYVALHSLLVGFPVAVLLRIVHVFYDPHRRELQHYWTYIWAYHYHHWSISSLFSFSLLSPLSLSLPLTLPLPPSLSRSLALALARNPFCSTTVEGREKLDALQVSLCAR